MDKITVTQDDVEAAKDEGATFVLEELAEMVGVSDWSIQDGSESWEGDVSATAYHILVQAKVINDWDNSVARHQTDAQMAAPDRLKNRMQSIADVLHCIADTVEDEGDRVYFSSTNDPHTIRRQAKAIETILAKLPASNAMRDALTVARNRLQSLAVRAPFNSSEGYDAAKWADEATAALAGQGTTLDRQTVELAEAEADYRKCHDLHGDSDMRTGRAWDRMRRAGDAIRASMDQSHVR